MTHDHIDGGHAASEFQGEQPAEDFGVFKALLVSVGFTFGCIGFGLLLAWAFPS